MNTMTVVAEVVIRTFAAYFIQFAFHDGGYFQSHTKQKEKNTICPHLRYIDFTWLFLSTNI